MIISSSQIGMSADHQQQNRVSERETLQRFQADNEGNVRLVSSLSTEDTRATLQAGAESASARIERQSPLAPASPSETGSSEERSDIEMVEPRLRLLAALVSMISHREIKLFDPSSLQLDPESADIGLTAPPAQALPAGTGMRYEWSRETSVSESTGFSAVGTLTTTDGKTIDIALDLQMEYHHTSNERLVITAGVQLKDPLVINFNGTAAELTGERLSFDIDADGKQDSINALSANSGLLMLDRNGDGVANDGRELFGALSGNGFADLAQYDEDNNGFIDEGDSVYGKLKIWIQAVDGSDQYLSLKDKGVGALYLGSVSTPFSLYTEGNEMRGQIRSSGLYVGENGSVGTLQQIDLVV